ncbi:hypothetical protein JHN54_17810, partial [Streptomyces sp. MBT70]
MSSEPAGPPDPVVRLADILARASDGVRPTPLELAEVLWLARHMRPGADTTGREDDPTGRETGERAAEGQEPAERTPPSPPPPSPAQPPPAPEPSAPAGPPPAHEPPPAP